MNKIIVRRINRFILCGLLLPMWAPPVKSNPAIVIALMEAGFSVEVLTVLEEHIANLEPLLALYNKFSTQAATTSGFIAPNAVIDTCFDESLKTMNPVTSNYDVTVGVEEVKSSGQAVVICAAKSKLIETQVGSGTCSGTATEALSISKTINEMKPETAVEAQEKAIASKAAWTKLANAEIARLYSSSECKARLFTIEALPKNYVVKVGQDFTRIEFPLTSNINLFAEIRAVKQQAGSALADYIAEMRLQEQIKEYIPGYREYRRDVLNREIKTLTDIISADPIDRIKGALDLRRLGYYDVIFDGSFGHAQHGLLKRLYNKDGSLRSLIADRSFESAAEFTEEFTKSALGWMGVKSKIIKQVVSAPEFQPTTKHGSHRHKGMPSDILDRARVNPKNALYEEVIRVGEAGDLPVLNDLRYRYSYDSIVERLTREYLRRWHKIIYDSNGVVRVGLQDPLYQTLMQEGKLKNILKHPSSREDFNKVLLGRHQLKQALQERWGIADSAPVCVHKALYRLLSSPAFKSRNSMVQELSALLNEAGSAQDLAALKNAFCLKNGEFKEIDRSIQSQPQGLLGFTAKICLSGVGSSAKVQPTIPILPNANSSMPMPPELKGPELEPENKSKIKTDVIFVEAEAPGLSKNLIKRNATYKAVEGTGENCRIVRPLSDSEAELNWAPKKWEVIRECKDDVTKIAENTGWSSQKIMKVKDHLFNNEHILCDGKGRFAPDPEIGAVWDRLYRGDFIKNDIKLLEHELYESWYEGFYNTDYITAHKATMDLAKGNRPWFTPKFKG